MTLSANGFRATLLALADRPRRADDGRAVAVRHDGQRREPVHATPVGRCPGGDRTRTAGRWRRPPRNRSARSNPGTCPRGGHCDGAHPSGVPGGADRRIGPGPGDGAPCGEQGDLRGRPRHVASRARARRVADRVRHRCPAGRRLGSGRHAGGRPHRPHQRPHLRRRARGRRHPAQRHRRPRHRLRRAAGERALDFARHAGVLRPSDSPIDFTLAASSSCCSAPSWAGEPLIPAARYLGLRSCSSATGWRCCCFAVRSTRARRRPARPLVRRCAFVRRRGHATRCSISRERPSLLAPAGSSPSSTPWRRCVRRGHGWRANGRAGLLLVPPCCCSLSSTGWAARTWPRTCVAWSACRSAWRLRSSSWCRCR